MQVCCIPSSFTLHNYPYLQMRKWCSERLSQFLMEILEERQPVWGRITYNMAQGMRVFCELGKG